MIRTQVFSSPPPELPAPRESPARGRPAPPLWRPLRPSWPPPGPRCPVGPCAKAAPAGASCQRVSGQQKEQPRAPVTVHPPADAVALVRAERLPPRHAGVALHALVSLAPHAPAESRPSRRAASDQPRPSARRCASGPVLARLQLVLHASCRQTSDPSPPMAMEMDEAIHPALACS